MSHPDGLKLVDERGAHRGFVDPMRVDGRSVLEDLWVMQGSVCDLRCKHCYTASSPSNNRLQQIANRELVPHLRDAERFRVKKVYFTGGEVFVNDDVLRGRSARNEEFVRNLACALEIAPVEILTNGRRYIRHHYEALADLRARFGDRLTIRITLESPVAAEHDRLRGRGTFNQTVETIAQLGAMGFSPVITAERDVLGTRSDDDIRDEYRALFARRAVRVEVNLIENVMETGSQVVQLSREGKTPAPEVFVTTACFAILNKQPETLMCHFSRCLQKIDGELRYYPCPVIYDDRRFDLGGSLAESLRRVYIGHKNCYDYCLKGRGGSCRTSPI